METERKGTPLMSALLESTNTTLEVRLCALEELPVGLGRAFDVEGHRIAVFRTRAGTVRAVANRCPHKNGPLADGMLAGDAVVCPLHNFRFDLNTGACDQPDVCSEIGRASCR